MLSPNDIAIIGMAGKFPKADDINAFWENIKTGKDCIGELPEPRFSNWKSVLNDKREAYPLSGYLERIDSFDADFFGIAPGEVPFIDPVQRLLLETVYEAMEYGGYGGNRLANTGTGVFISCGNSGYKELISRSSFSLVADIGNLPAVSAGRISHEFGLRGPSLLIDTACSSSLAALHYACESLKRGECPMAVVGAANIYAYFDGKVASMDPGVGSGSKGNISSPGDRETGAVPGVSHGCRVFDKTSRGVVNGEGVGALLLKPLNKALADKDVICAVIKGSALNHNGNRTATISGQRPESLAEVIHQALENARVHPETISYIEASGAATNMGDPIEIKSISDVFSTYTDKKQFCPIGSVKANIGHLNHTSGMASLIKVILALQHQQIPPQANFNEPNPYIDFENSPVYIDTQLKAWEVKEGIPRRAGVSSFSVSGTNCHMILEEAPAAAGNQKQDADIPDCFHLVTLSARNPASLKQLCQALGQNPGKYSHHVIEDICYTLNTGRGQHGYRLALVCRDKEELIEKLSLLDIDNNGQLTGECANDPEIFYNTPVGLEKNGSPGNKGVFLFSGGEADLGKTCWDFYGKGFQAAKYMDECRAFVDLEKKPQALYFAFQYALAKLWMDLGIKPAYVLGYGIGKYVSKAISGKLTLEQALITCMAESEQEDFYTSNKDKFKKNIELSYSQTQVLFLEIGAENNLAAMAEEVLCGKPGGWVLASYSPKENEKVLLTSIGLVYTLGLSLDFSCLFPGGKVPLPTYPFNRRRYWIEQEHKGETAEEELHMEEFSGTLRPRPPLDIEYIAPKTQFEKSFANILRKFFGFEQVGIHDNFFEIGLNSLTLIHVNHLLKEKTVYAIPIVAMFEYPNIHELEQYLKQQDSGKTGVLQERDIPVLPVLPAVRENRGKGGLEIAVIGMAGKFPGAANVEEFWNNLRNGVESVTFFSDEELAGADVSEEQLNNPNYVKAGTELEDKEYFDAVFFGYTPQEAEIMDPQVRLFHECSWQALEDAGYDPFSYPGSIGMYAGSASSFTWEALSMLSGKSSILSGFASTLLTNSGFISTRVSHKLDLKGPGLTVFTTCSTSLVAIHLACQALLNGECDMALAGGASITVQPGKGYVYQEGMVFSPDGHCRAFDARAKGAVFGEGIGIVLLKRLEEAIAHRDHIYAVVKGSAINNDGMGKVSYTAPGKRGQQEVIRKALEISGVPPGSITYIETHGTGTTLGDTIEIEALKHAFNTDQKGFCAIGSVKTNISHLDTAAGVAGFIKTVLALTHRLIPPSLNFETPNPHIDLKNSPFYVADRAVAWNNNGDHGGPLRAGVSSFGIGGTNAHVVLEEWPTGQSAQRTAHRGDRSAHGAQSRGRGGVSPPSSSRKYQLILLSAKTQSALEKMAENLAEYLKKNLLNHGNHENPVNPGQNPGLTLADVAYTLQAGRKHFQHRCMLVCHSSNEAIDILSTPGSRKMKTFFNTDDNRSVVLMFPGLGSQYVNMGLELYQKEPVFAEEMDRCFEILKPLMDSDIKEILYPRDSVSEVSEACQVSQVSAECRYPDNRSHRSHTSYNSNKSEINQPGIAQVVVFIFEYALAKLLMKWGIRPNAVIGYSFGEYIAACISGVFSLEHALKLVVSRGQLIQKLAPGAMLSVPLPMEEVKSFKGSELSIAVDNGPSCIVSGPLSAIDAFEKKMKEKRCLCLRLDQAQYALHSPMMEPILDEFAGVVSKISLNQPQVPMISNVTGQWVEAGEVTNPAYWATHLKETVRFAPGISELVKEPGTVFLEVGPGRDLSALVQRYINNNSGQHILDLVRHPGKDISDVYFLLSKIGQLWLYGKNIDWSAFYFQEKRHRIILPTYPFESQRFPLEGNFMQMAEKIFSEGTPGMKKPDVSDWFYVPSWKRIPTISQRENKNPDQTVQTGWLVFMDEDNWGEPLVKQLENQHQDVTIIRAAQIFRKINSREYTINPGDDNQYEKLFSNIKKEKGVIPGKMIHLWNVTTKERNDLNMESIDSLLNLGYYSLLNIARTIGKQDIEDDIDIIVVTNNMQGVVGGDQQYPGKTTLLGAVRCIPKEYGNISLRSIDIILPQPGHPAEETLPGCIINEFFSRDHEPVMAFRNHFRWIETYEPVRLEKSGNDTWRLKDGGVYLVTGGLGGIGHVLAQQIVRNVKNPKLILIGRTKLPEPGEWDQWLKEHDEKDSISTKIAKVRGLEKMGAEVFVGIAENSNLEQMQEVISRAEERFGPINGVVHSAGLPDGAMIQFRTREQSEILFSAKLKGTLILDMLLKHVKLDFFVLCSSLDSIMSNAGNVGYCSANSFLNAFATYKFNKDKVFTVAINWPRWQGLGMAVMQENLHKELKGHNLSGGLEIEDGIDAFSRILGENLSQVAVASHNLSRAYEHDKTVGTEALITEFDTADDTLENLFARPDLTSDYVAPQDETEQSLAKIWQRLFGISSIGARDDFFELGGDSLKAVIAISRIHKVLNVEIPIAEFFNRPNIRELAQYINDSEQTIFYSIEPGEKKEYYPVSSAQKRLYILQQMNPDSTAYNEPQVIPLPIEFDLGKIDETFKGMIKRHESLRTSFHLVNDMPVQVVHDEVEFKIENYQDKIEAEAEVEEEPFGGTRGLAPLSTGPSAPSPESREQRIKSFIKVFSRPFDLANAPLLRLGLVNNSGGNNILLVDMHHIILDRVSYEILEKDFLALHEGKELLPLRLQYKDYAEWQNRPEQIEIIKKQGEYWVKEFQKEISVLNLPIDYERPTVHNLAGEIIHFVIDKEKTSALKRMAADQGATLYMILLALFNVLLSKVCSQEDIIIGSPAAGRRHNDLDSIIGMFVNTLVFRNYPTGDKSFKEFFSEVKEKVLEAFKNQDFQFEDLVERVVKKRHLNRNPIFDVMIMFQDQASIETNFPEVENTEPNKIDVVWDLLLDGKETGENLSLTFGYRTSLFKTGTIKKFIKYFKEIISAVIENEERYLKNIKISHELFDKKIEIPQAEGDFVF